jgi:GTPase SAR1 family protein
MVIEMHACVQGCGKTSLVRRFTADEFSKKYRPSTSLDMAIKEITTTNNTNIIAQVIIRLYKSYKHACILQP